MNAKIVVAYWYAEFITFPKTLLPDRSVEV